jgi:hypothetical protein
MFHFGFFPTACIVHTADSQLGAQPAPETHSHTAGPLSHALYDLRKKADQRGGK